MHIFFNKSSQSHLGRAASPPLTAENGFAHCVCYYLCNAHCNESSHSAAGMLHPQRSATCFKYVTLRCPIQNVEIGMDGGWESPIKSEVRNISPSHQRRTSNHHKQHNTKQEAQLKQGLADRTAKTAVSAAI